MIPSAFENVKRLSDAQLQSAVAAARQGDMTAIQALNLTSATPILAEMMRREQMREMFQKNMSPSTPGPQTVLDKLLAQADSSRGIGELEVPGMMEEESYAGGGIVSFAQGKDVQGDPGLQEYPQDFQSMPETPVTDEQTGNMTPQQYAILRRRLLQQQTEAARAALGERPSELGSEEADRLFRQRQEALAAITQPYMERMRAIIEQNRINEPQRKEELERAAYNEGFASMIGAPRRTSSRLGSLAQNIGAAVRGGMGSYKKGIAQLEEAKRLHARADLDAAKAEAEFAKGNFSEARKYVDDMIESRRNAARAYSQAQRDITNREEAGIGSIDRELRAEILAKQQADQIAARERQAEADRASKERIARIRVAAQGRPDMTQNQFNSAVFRQEKLIREDRRRVRELEKLYGKGTAELEQAITDEAIEAVNRVQSARTGKEPPPKTDKGGASPPPGGKVVGRIGENG